MENLTLKWMMIKIGVPPWLRRPSSSFIQQGLLRQHLFSYLSFFNKSGFKLIYWVFLKGYFHGICHALYFFHGFSKGIFPGNPWYHALICPLQQIGTLGTPSESTNRSHGKVPWRLMSETTSTPQKKVILHFSNPKKTKSPVATSQAIPPDWNS